jgi:4-methyl-5(b-hydroxyethyl)-thiazole monophosphate biosynthesis
MKSALTILPNSFEELEAVAPIDLLRRAGVTVTVAALTEAPLVIGRSNLALRPDTTLDAVLDQDFDLIFLPGGPGVRHLRANPRIRTLLLRQYARGGLLAAICAAPTVLHDAGLLAGRRYTAHPSVAGELSAIISEEKVVRDGQILTSRGAGTAIDFGLVLVSALQGPAAAQQVANAIAW